MNLIGVHSPLHGPFSPQHIPPDSMGNLLPVECQPDNLERPFPLEAPPCVIATGKRSHQCSLEAHLDTFGDHHAPAVLHLDRTASGENSFLLIGLRTQQSRRPLENQRKIFSRIKLPCCLDTGPGCRQLPTIVFALLSEFSGIPPSLGPLDSLWQSDRGTHLVGGEFPLSAVDVPVEDLPLLLEVKRFADEIGDLVGMNRLLSEKLILFANPETKPSLKGFPHVVLALSSPLHRKHLEVDLFPLPGRSLTPEGDVAENPPLDFILSLHPDLDRLGHHEVAASLHRELTVKRPDSVLRTKMREDYYRNQKSAPRPKHHLLLHSPIP